MNSILILSIAALATFVVMLYTPFILSLLLRTVINDRGYSLSWVDVIVVFSWAIVIQFHLHGVSVIQIYNGWH